MATKKYSLQQILEQADEDGFIEMLNQTPPETWILEYNGFKYLPVERVEFLLKTIFKSHKIEVLLSQITYPYALVNVRVNYLDPISGEWRFHDGVGATEINKPEDGGAATSLPQAKTYAIKDACDHFGRLFGSDLNRKNTIEYEKSVKKESKNPRDIAANKEIEEARKFLRYSTLEQIISNKALFVRLGIESEYEEIVNPKMSQL